MYEERFKIEKKKISWANDPFPAFLPDIVTINR